MQLQNKIKEKYATALRRSLLSFFWKTHTQLSPL